MKILIIEDQRELSDSVRDYLSHENFTCEMAYDYHGAIEMIRLHDYACIILDINLPHGNGLGILKELKSNNKADGILIISAIIRRKSSQGRNRIVLDKLSLDLQDKIVKGANGRVDLTASTRAAPLSPRRFSPAACPAGGCPPA